MGRAQVCATTVCAKAGSTASSRDSVRHGQPVNGGVDRTIIPVRTHSGGRVVLGFALSAVVITSGLVLGGCSSPEATTLPSGISIDVYQSRIDYSEHKLEVAVTNSTVIPFEVLALSFRSPVFSPAVQYDRAPTTVRAGTTTDFRLLLPPARCDVKSGAPTVVVRFSSNGLEGRTTMTPGDRIHQLPSIAAEDCRAGAVAAVASIVPSSKLRFVTIHGTKAAVLDFTATPTGAGGLLKINDVRGTVLLGARNPSTGVIGDTVPIGIDLSNATKNVTFSLTLLPARCDPHVVLEDKRGTFFTFTVTTALDTGRIFIGVSDDVRIQLYDFVGSSCGWT